MELHNYMYRNTTTCINQNRKPCNSLFMIITACGMDHGSWATHVPYDDKDHHNENDDNDIAQHGGLTPANRLTYLTSCTVSNFIITIGFMTYLPV